MDFRVRPVGMVAYGKYTDWSDMLREQAAKLVAKHNIKIEELTEFQVASAMKQAIECGDFQKNIAQNGSQSVDYIPYRQWERLRSKIDAMEQEIKRSVGAAIEALEQ